MGNQNCQQTDAVAANNQISLLPVSTEPHSDIECCVGESGLLKVTALAQEPETICIKHNQRMTTITSSSNLEFWGKPLCISLTNPLKSPPASTDLHGKPTL